MLLSDVAFQPTLPARGATIAMCAFICRWMHFNPRSPHGERRSPAMPRLSRRNFNPRSPHGERHGRKLVIQARLIISTHAPRTGSDMSMDTKLPMASQFQPTLPARGATHRRAANGVLRPISTHAPRTGSDIISM